MHVCVLGAGLVGRAMALDLADTPGFTVTSIDRDDEALDRLRGKAHITTRVADLGELHTIPELIETADLVVCAVPGFMGFRTLEAVLRAGKNVVDISFFPEDAFELDDLARENDAIAVVDCGVAPGLCNVIAGDVIRRLDRTDSYACYVGGLPERREGPFEYKEVFSPIDVLEEYTRPARLRENGETIVRPALSEVELRDFPGVGTLEAFNTDGLRSLLRTLDVPDMKEKTLRYPGHADLMRVFRDSGFFNSEEVHVDGNAVRPIDVAAILLSAEWKLGAGERDLTVMQVIIEGMQHEKKVRVSYSLLDRLDEASGIHSMARTTGYTATSVARLVLDGAYAKTGISPPEYLGKEEGFLDKLLTELAKKRIQVTSSIVEVNAQSARP